MAEVFHQQLRDILSRTDGLTAIVFSDREGVPILKATSSNADDLAVRSDFLGVTSNAMGQANKLSMGKCRRMICTYGSNQVVNFNKSPILVTLVAKANAVTGMLLNLEPEVTEIANDLRIICNEPVKDNC